MTLIKQHSRYILFSTLFGLLACTVYMIVNISNTFSIPLDWKTTTQSISVPSNDMYYSSLIQSIQVGIIVFTISLLSSFLIIVLRKKALNKKLIHTLAKEDKDK